MRIRAAGYVGAHYLAGGAGAGSFPHGRCVSDGLASNWGKLQSIHHVDDYTIIDAPSEHFPGAPAKSDPLFLLTLGPAIKPDHEVRTGDTIRQANRVWADLDLLLTSKTISDAYELTKARRR